MIQILQLEYSDYNVTQQRCNILYPNRYRRKDLRPFVPYNLSNLIDRIWDWFWWNLLSHADERRRIAEYNYVSSLFCKIQFFFWILCIGTLGCVLNEKRRRTIILTIQELFYGVYRHSIEETPSPLFPPTFYRLLTLWPNWELTLRKLHLSLFHIGTKEARVL